MPFLGWPIALLPNFTQPVVTVSVTYPNVGPQQMETLITRPIENAVSRVNGIQQINSSSSEGNVRVTAQFYFGTNIDTAAVDVQEQVSRIWGTLPNDPEPAAAGHHEVRFELAAGRPHVRDRPEHDAARPRRPVHQSA